MLWSAVDQHHSEASKEANGFDPRSQARNRALTVELFGGERIPRSRSLTVQKESTMKHKIIWFFLFHNVRIRQILGVFT